MIQDFPEDPTKLEIEHLTFLFQHGGLAASNPDAKVAAMSSQPLALGSAFLGSLAALEIQWVDTTTELPNRFVVKQPTQDPGGRAVGTMLNVWAREAEFYARLAPLITTPVPHCRVNFVEGDKTILILDDLYPATPGDQVAGASPDQAHLAVEALAQLHAPFWNQRRSPTLSWVPGIDGKGVAEGLGAAMAASLPKFTSRFGDLLPDQGLQWLHDFVPSLGGWQRELVSRPLTITHADYRLANMLFGSDNGVSIVDWQTAMFSGGATDLSFFLATNLTVEIRRALEEELIGTYVETLIGHGVPPSETDLIPRDYEQAHLWWMGMLANNLSNIETPDAESQQLFEAMLTRLYAAALDAQSGRFLASY
jgi:hypothetical protein